MSYKIPSPRRHSRLSTPVRLGVAAVAACFFVGPVMANPVNPSVVNGAAAFNQAGSVLTVTNSNGAIINWEKFSIKTGETTHFAQPAASSAVLNRVLNDPTAIYGTLSSNGRVWLVNPAGIMVGPGGRIDAAGFVASTLAVRNEDFLAGRHLFINDGNARNVINQGEIRTPAGGSVYLIGANVSNEGIITTPKGETILASGATVSLIDSATPGVKVDITGAEGNATNLGQITAEAGRIGIAGVIVRNSGQLNAGSVVNDGGRIFLKASQDAYVDKAGRIVTTGTRGGSVEVLGNRVAVMDDASVDASGDKGGGSIKVGGDYQGKNPEIQNASITYFGPKASLKADATGVGAGGTVIVWADDTTRAYGNVSAKGGALGGNGGFVETSGKRQLDFKARIDASASTGKSGTVLLDPDFIVIANGAGGANDSEIGGADGNIFSIDGGNATFTLSEQAIEGLQTGMVLLQANKGITLNDLTSDGILSLHANVQNFTLQTMASASNEGISFQNAANEIKSADGAAINLIAGGGGSLTNIGKITSLGGGYPGMISLAAAGGSINLKGAITATGGDAGGLVKLMAGSIDLQGAITASGGGSGGSVKLMAGAGGITSNSSGIVTANTLEVISSGGVTLNAANAINILAAKVTGAISFTNSGSFAIGMVGGEPKFAYVPIYNSSLVMMYSIDAATGGLTPIGSIATGSNPSHLVVDPSGRFVYLTTLGTNSVSAYSINQTTGALSLVGSPVAAGSGPYGVAIDPSGRFAYVTNSGSNDVSAFSVNLSTGALTPVGTVAAGTYPISVTVDPSGRFAYVANYNSNSVSAYSINSGSGALTPIGTAAATGTTPHSVGVDPSGKFAYVVNYGSETVSAYSINQTTGELSPVGSPVASGGHAAYSIAFAPNGKFAYVNNASDGSESPPSNISTFSINQTTGVLTSIGVVATGDVTGSTWVAVDPSGRFAYSPNWSFSNLRLFDIDQIAGTLTASVVPGSVVATPYSANDVAIAGSGTSGISASGNVTLVAATGGITLHNAVKSGSGNIEIAADSVAFVPGAFVGAIGGNVGIRTLALTLPLDTSISASGFVELAPLGNAGMCIYVGTCAAEFSLDPSSLSRVVPTGALILGRAVADTSYTGMLSVLSDIPSSVINGSWLALNGYDVEIDAAVNIGTTGVAFDKPLDILANRNLTVTGGIVLGGTRDLVMNAGQSVNGLLWLNNLSALVYAGNITLNNPRGAITGDTVLQTPSAGTLNANAGMISYGGISLMGGNQVGTFVASNTGSAGIQFFNIGDFNLGTVTNMVPLTPITIGGGNAITQVGDVVAYGGNITVIAGTNSTMNDGTKAQSYGGSVRYEAGSGSVQLGLLYAGSGFVNVVAGMNITDGNGVANNIKAAAADLVASYDDSGPGSIDVDTQVQSLMVNNDYVYNPGTINIRNSGSPLAVSVFSAPDTTQLTITNNDTINVGHIGGATHTTLIATGGSSDITVAADTYGTATLLATGNILLDAGRDILVMHDYVDAGGTVTATAGRNIRVTSDGSGGIQPGLSYIQAANGINLTMLTGGLYVDGTSSDAAYISTASGNINVVTSTGFTNSDVLGNGANGVLYAPLGRWLIYAPNPATVVGAPAYNFKQYNTTYGGAIQGAGNGVIYTLAPTISADLAGTVSKVYDGTNLATLTAANYGGLIGMEDGDTVAILGNPAAGTYDTKNVGGGKTVTVGGLSIVATNTTAAAYGGSAQVYGYLFNGTASGAIGAITPASLSVSGLTANNKVYDATAVATVSGTLTGLIVGDAVSLGTPTATFNNKNVGIAKPVSVSGITLAGADAGNYIFTPPVGLALTANITPASLGVTGLSALDKVYDGTTKATLSGTFVGLFSGDVVGFAPGGGAFADRHVGTAKAVSPTGQALAGPDAGNYVVGAALGGATASITQRPLVNWVGGTDNNWSTATNWAGGALPDRANVAAVNLGGAAVSYDYGSALADAAILASLSGTGSFTLAGGTLTVTGGTLTVPTWIQTAGDLRGLGGLTVSQSMSMNGPGTIDIGGPVSITHTGDLTLGRIKTAGALSVTATGSLSGTNAAGTWVQTAGSIMLDASGIGEATDMLQTRTQELAINNRAGNAWIFNTGLVDVTGSSAGRLHLESKGGIVAGSSTQVTAGGLLELIAHSPVVIGAAGVQGGTGVLLRADTPDASNSSILISGPVSAPGGAVVVAAYNDVTQNANITGNSVIVGSDSGSITMAATAQTQATGGNVSYKAPAGNMTLASINAGSGSVSLDAGGSIAPAPGTTGANITGASAFINAGGSLELSTNVTLLDVNVGGNFAVSNGGTVFSSTPASTSGADQATKDLTNATDSALTDKTPTDRTEAPPPPDTPKTDTSKPFVDPGKTTGGTEGTFGSEGDKPSTETRKDEGGTRTASSGKDENGNDQKDEKDEKDKKDKKSDETKDEKKDDKPVAKKVAQCT